MALGAALVDRARFLRLESDSRKVEGRVRRATVESAWFRARLTVRPASKRLDEAGRPLTVPTPELLCDRRDENGDPVVPRPDDKIEVKSLQLGDDVWHVDGEPVPLRKKRRVIGWQLILRRANEPKGDRRIAVEI